jgi:CBS domain-containing protein
MLLRNLIHDQVPSLKTTDTAKRALEWMQVFRHSHLPVIGDSGYIGLVYEKDLVKLENTDVPLNSLSLPFSRLYLNENQHIFDAIKFAAHNDFSVIPILSDKEQYLGLVTLTDLVKALAEANSVQNPGGIVVLEMEKSRYSLSEISRIIEAEGAQILSSIAIVAPDPTKVEVTLKINFIDLTRILAGFYRHQIDVKASYHQSEFQKDLQNRYDAFMNYLKM